MERLVDEAELGWAQPLLWVVWQQKEAGRAGLMVCWERVGSMIK